MVVDIKTGPNDSDDDCDCDCDCDCIEDDDVDIPGRLSVELVVGDSSTTVELDPVEAEVVVVVKVVVKLELPTRPTACVLLYTVIRRTTSPLPLPLPLAPLADVDANACRLANRAVVDTFAIPPHICAGSPGQGVSHASFE